VSRGQRGGSPTAVNLSFLDRVTATIAAFILDENSSLVEQYCLDGTAILLRLINFYLSKLSFISSQKF
jgi:hypothetical protein